jgi:hypothetical protein
MPLLWAPHQHRHPWNGQPQLAKPAEWRPALAGSYTAIGLAATRPATCSPGVSNFSATSGRMPVSRAECEVQRRVHPHVSRQYQRTSRQALPPSATIWPAGKRMPHIQHDLTWADSLPSGAGCCRLVMTCSPRSPSARAVVSACPVGLPTAAPVRSASRSSSESPTLMRTLPLHLGERRAATVISAWEQGYRQRRRGGMAAGSLRVPGPAGTSVAWAHHLWVPISHRSNI